MMKNFCTILLLSIFPISAFAASAESGEYTWALLKNKPKNVSSFYMEKGKVYPDGSIDAVPIKVDLDTFVVSVKEGDNLGNFWAKDKNHAYRAYDRLKDADAASFEVMTTLVAKDNKHVHCWNPGLGGFDGEVNKLADPKTFKILRSPEDSAHSQFFYYRDAKHIYSKWCALIKDADPDSFEMVANPTTSFDAKDKNRKYGLGEVAK